MIEKTPTLSPSMLDAWRFYVAEVISLEDITNRLLRVKTPPNEKMIIGQGYNDLISEGALTTWSEDKHISFDAESATQYGLMQISKLKDIRFEVPFLQDFGAFRLSGRVDGLQSRMVHEFKASSTKKGYLDYLNSPQWQCYSVVTGLPVTYHQIRYKIHAGLVVTTGVDVFDFKAGRDTEAEIVALAMEVIRFADKLGLEIK